MSIEKFKEMDATEIPIGKLLSMIGKGHIFYLNHKLEKLNINASQLHSLFEIKKNPGINQEEIAFRCNVDKGSIARTISKLEEKGFIKKEIDENNRRQNIISLTKDGEETIEKAIKILDNWEKEVFKDYSKEEKEKIQNLLKDIVIKTVQINLDLKNKEKD